LVLERPRFRGCVIGNRRIKPAAHLAPSELTFEYDEATLTCGEASRLRAVDRRNQGSASFELRGHACWLRRTGVRSTEWCLNHEYKGAINQVVVE
jgi:hypothetical protein